MVFGPAIVGSGLALSGAIFFQSGVVCGPNPVFCDVRPGSGYLAALGQTTETFKRAAVLHHSSNNWLMWRFIGDNMGQTPVGGDDAVRAIDRLYWDSVKCAVVGGLFGWIWPPAGVAGAACAGLVFVIAATDALWQYAVSDGHASDGFIPYTSQQYAGVAAENQIIVRNAPSHTKELQSREKTGRAIVSAIQRAAEFTSYLQPPP
ncbi:MAG: hypothetical protein HYX65_08330 [Gemmatimonadetes bacterium]|nr:hypothetical protein [Gemmatimonadota bacterium]